MEEKQKRGRSLVGPVLLIMLGIVFLLNNLGFLNWGVWETILRLWPVILIAFGLEVVFGRGTIWGSLAGALTILIIVGIVALFTGALGARFTFDGTSPPARTESISQTLGGADNAEVEIRTGVGELRLSGLEDSENLIQGGVDLGRGERLEQNFSLVGQTAHYTLGSERVNLLSFTGDRRDFTWDLRLNTGVPMKLDINTGVGLAELDLRDLEATEIDVHTGIGKTVIHLPESGDITADITGGIGETVIYLPANMAVRIRAQKGIGSVEIDGNNMHNDDTYVSTDFDSAANRVDLKVKSGIGKIEIHGGGWGTLQT